MAVKVHEVQPNESLWRIAEKYLGDGKRYPEIMKINNLTHTTIKAGQKLNILVSESTTPTPKDFEKIGKLFDAALDDVKNLKSVKALFEALEG